MLQMESEFAGQFVHVDTHVSGDLYTTGVGAELAARGSRYGVSGIPDAFFDGTSRVTGASSCDGVAGVYRSRITSLISASGGVSPIDLSVILEVVGNQATITGTAELVDNITLPALQITLFLMENPVIDCCDSQGNDTYHSISRGIRSTAISPSYGGGAVEVQQTWTVSSAWVPQALYAVAVVENIAAPRTVHQAADFRNHLSVTFEQSIVSLPDGGGTVEVAGTVTNGNDADVFDLTASGGEAWTYEFQLAGDPTWYTSTSIPLDTGESRGITFRVVTDATEAKDDATLFAQSQSLPFSYAGVVRIFNGSPAILIVDSDGTSGSETGFEDAVTAMGGFFDLYEADPGSGPLLAGLSGYDVVIWDTGYVVNAITADRSEALVSFVQAGGSLVFSSMGFPSSVGNTPEMRETLGLASWGSTTTAQTIGVAGDPITEGEDHVLSWPQTDRTDRTNPRSGATVIFYNETAVPIALRNEPAGGGRVVYSSIAHDAFASASPHVAGRMINWVLGDTDPTSVEGSVPFVTSPIVASPNPFSPATDLSFRLSDWAAGEPVALRIVDAGGRVVSTVVQGTLEPGAHTVSWDGTDGGGRQVANGLYFAVLSSADGEQRTKLVRVR